MASPLRSWVWEASFYQLKYDRCVPSGIAMGVKKKEKKCCYSFLRKGSFHSRSWYQLECVTRWRVNRCIQGDVSVRERSQVFAEYTLLSA